MWEKPDLSTRRDSPEQRTFQRSMKGAIHIKIFLCFLSYKNIFSEPREYERVMKLVEIHLDWMCNRAI